MKKNRAMKGKPRPAAAASSLRIRAESELRNRPPRPRPASANALSAAAQQRPLHELQVHQVELEMQNAELHEARDRLEVLLEKYTDLYDFAPVGYFTLDRRGRILEANLTGASLLGVDRSRLVARSFQQSLNAAERPAFSRFLERVFAKPGKHVWEARLVKDGGGSFWADLHATSGVASSIAGKHCRLAVSDISALKRAEEAQRRVQALAAANAEANQEIARRRALEASLRESEQTQRALLAEAQTLHVQRRHLARQVLLAQEEERRKISRELHDEIAQILTGITVHLATLSGGVSPSPRELRMRVDKAQRLVGQSIAVVRRFARELRPSVLDDLGLVPALRSYVKELSGRSNLRVHLTTFGEVESLDNSSKTMLYRVAQEALTNVVRHARAKNATVSIQKVRGGVRLEVRDDGRSFSVERMLASRKSGRLGLLGMRERVEMLDGRFAIESVSGVGTTLSAEIPWDFSV